MKRTIKFRGRAISDSCGVHVDKIVYGDFVHTVPMSSFPGVVDFEGFVHEVEPESVAQLVGYDANGREVYEGDILIHASGAEWVAALGSYARYSGLATYNFKKLTLKED